VAWRKQYHGGGIRRLKEMEKKSKGENGSLGRK